MEPPAASTLGNTSVSTVETRERAHPPQLDVYADLLRNTHISNFRSYDPDVDRLLNRVEKILKQTTARNNGELQQNELFSIVTNLIKRSGIPILHRALQYRHIGALRTFCRFGADPNRFDDTGINAPLHTAVMHHNIPAIEALLEAGAKPNIPQGPRTNGQRLTAWELTFVSTDTQTADSVPCKEIQTLLEKAGFDPSIPRPLDPRRERGPRARPPESLLSWFFGTSIDSGKYWLAKPEEVCLWMIKPADPKVGLSPFHRGILDNNLAKVKYLFNLLGDGERQEALLKRPTSNGWRPLQLAIAAEGDTLEIGQFVLSKGAKAQWKQKQKGAEEGKHTAYNTAQGEVPPIPGPLALAVLCGKEEYVKMLCRYGASLKFVDNTLHTWCPLDLLERYWPLEKKAKFWQSILESTSDRSDVGSKPSDEG